MRSVDQLGRGLQLRYDFDVLWIDQDTANCSVAAALAAVGDRATLLLLREALNDVRRFEDFTHHTALARNVVADRLARLVSDGLVERRPYQPAGERRRHEYVITAIGRDLAPVLAALMEWGDRYRSGPDGPARMLTHAGCGRTVHVRFVCDAGHLVDADRELISGPGPGARPAPPRENLSRRAAAR